jgi:hypothetical protein
MGRLFAVAVLLLVLPAAGAAAPCIPGTLASYVALGSGGCDIGGTQFSEFVSGPPLFGGTEIVATAINVTPFGLGFDFGLDASAGANDLTGVAVGFQVSGTSIGSSTLSMIGSSASPSADPFETGGVVTAVEDLCVGAAFLFPGFCLATTANNIVADDGVFPVLTDTESFTAAMLLGVLLDITIDGGTAGAAALDGTVKVAFGAGAAVPEPAVMILLGAGLLGIAARRRASR